MKSLKNSFLFVLMTVLSVFAISCSSDSSSEDLEAYNKVYTTEDYKTYMETCQSEYGYLQLLDYRSAEEYAAGHIPGAVNIPATNQNVKDEDGEWRSAVASKFDTSKKIFIYGSKQQSDMQMYIGGVVSKIGFGKSKTYQLMTGFEGWEAAGYDIEK